MSANFSFEATLPSWNTAVIGIAKQAGEAILDIYNQSFTITQKGDNTPLTEADLAAHNIIMEGLSALTPAIPVLSEESDNIPFSERNQWDVYWLVDPLDGTKEFIRHNGEFTVNIALIYQQRPVLGVIYAPVLDTLYYAYEGFGAYKQVKQCTQERISVQKPHRDTLVIAGSRSHQSGKVLESFLAQVEKYTFISMGSSLKSCLVAEGSADIYVRLGPTSEWDTAAAQCIVKEAGGLLTDTQLEELRYNTKDSLLNPHFLVFGDESMHHLEWLKMAQSTTC